MLWYKLKINLCIFFGLITECSYASDGLEDTYDAAFGSQHSYYNGWNDCITWEQVNIGKGIFKHWRIYIFENGN